MKLLKEFNRSTVGSFISGTGERKLSQWNDTPQESSITVDPEQALSVLSFRQTGEAGEESVVLALATAFSLQ